MKEINSISEWSSLLESSNEKPVLIMKHSTQCSVSLGVFSDMAEAEKKDILSDIYWVEVRNHRDVSNKISEDLNIIHASPQFFVIYNKESQLHLSHFEIKTDLILEILKNI